MNISDIIISSIIMNIAEIISYYKISNTKINTKDFKIYLIYLLQTFLIVINYAFTTNVIKVIITFLIMLLTCKLLFRHKKIVECLVIVFVSELLIIFSEFCFMILASFYSKVNNQELIQMVQGTVFTNLGITIIILLFLFTNIPNKLYKKIMRLVSNISFNKIIIFLSFIIICSSFLFYISYYNKNSSFTLIVNFIIMTVYFIIVVMILIKERKYNIINAKYLTTLNELEEYENIINEFRIINHENENQLNSIKGMTKNKKVIAYIDEITNNKNAVNTFILKQALLIPTGGLRGLIYSKLILMKKFDIKYNLHIDKKINSKLMKSVSTKTMLDICQIIGVYLDNAIEAVSSIDKKEILINIYKDENINIEIINNYQGILDISKIGKAGYTTKEGMHGYGLNLVNKILKENNDLTNDRVIKQDYFKQKLIIKIKHS